VRLVYAIFADEKATAVPRLIDKDLIDEALIAKAFGSILAPALQSA
jgi:hypothetical protein